MGIGNVIIWLVLGAVSGWIASMITGNNARMGMGWNLVVGLVGAFVGGWLAGIFGWGPATGLNIWSFVVSIVGAVILLCIVNLIRGKDK